MKKTLLIETRKILENGWCQGAFTRTTGEHCVRAAFNQAAENLGLDWVQKFPATEAITWHPKVIKHTGIVSWNDHAATTKAEVLSVFDDVIAECP